MDNREAELVPSIERDQVADALLQWLNEYGELPPRIGKIEAEFLDTSNSMAVMSITAPYKINSYISGSYTAQYQFAIAYRTSPKNSAKRLEAMDVLTKIAVWAESQEDMPDLGEKKFPISIERNSPAVMVARYEDGSEDFQILMTFTYEVKP